MEIIKQVVGIDISMNSSTVRFGTIDTHQNQTISNEIDFNNDHQGNKKLLSWALKSRVTEDAPLWFVMEATGVYYENLAYFLVEAGHKVTVLLPNKVKNFGRTLNIKSKTDPIDAATLTMFGLEKQLTPWQAPSQAMRKLKELCREYQSIKQLAVQIMNQIHAKEHSHEPEKGTLKRLNQQLTLFRKQEKQIINELREIVNQDTELKKRISKMEKIEGVGFLTIVNVIAETNGFALIKNQKQLASYAGLDVVHNESGLKKHKTSISKKGNKNLRRSVYMPALSAVRCNEQLKNLYIRLAIKKNNKKVALIAVARKLLLLIYTIWKNNTDYVPNYNPVKQ
jgi:transposase